MVLRLQIPPSNAWTPFQNESHRDDLSLTRSTSPTIGSCGSGSNSLRTTPRNDALVASLLPPPPSPCPTPRPDSTIRHWKRGELLGEGTFGRVFKGFNVDTAELFAVKEIEVRATSNSAERTKQLHKLGEEIALMKNLQHKHIVQYKGSQHTATHFFIFMEFIPGGSIASMLKQYDAFSEDVIRIFTRQIVAGVAYLHAMGIVHRDIKGANVLVNEQGVGKLADFGCSKHIPQILTTSLEESLRSIRGSIPWMAPEVVKQLGHGFKADIWSVGATVIEMATATHPWPASTTGLAAMFAIATTQTSPPIPSHLSVEAKNFLKRCFCVDPQERATAAELAQHPFLRPR